MRLISAKSAVSLCLFVGLGFNHAAAQNSNKENAPYSRYGIGELRSGTNVMLRGMGYASTAYSSLNAVNTENPASYANLLLTTYEGGFTGGVRTIDAANKSYTTGSASLAYLNIGIPLGKHAGMALGLSPQSQVYYHNLDSSSLEGIGKTAAEYTGEGGLNFAYIGLAGKIKGFSLGVNAGYMFGTIRNTSRLDNLDTTNVLGTDFSSFTRIGGVYTKIGAQYDAKLNKKIGLRLGATAALSQDLHGYRDNYSVGYHYVSGEEVDDTAYHTDAVAGKITLPLSWSVGAALYGTNWTVSADLKNTKWQDYRNYGRGDSVADNSFRVSVGGEYTPNPASIYKYLPRVTYRLGFYYGTDYVRLQNTDIPLYAFTAGASLPFKRSSDRIHVALEVGKHGTEKNSLIQENFFRLHLGISLNDKWFIKRKYD